MAWKDEKSTPPTPLIALAGWLIPGAGYWLIGQRARAIIAGATIIVLYILGLFVAGVRVIEVPGYDSQTGQRLMLRGGWIITNGGMLSEIGNKPWFAAQILAGPLCVGSASVSVGLAQQGYDRTQRAQVTYPRPHAPLEGVGTLYTALAGMLNLFIIIDSTHRAGRREHE